MLQLPEVFYNDSEDSPIVVRDGKILFNPKYTYLLFRGGRGRGGSWTMVQVAVVMSLQEPMEILVVRQHKSNIKQSVWKLISNTARSLGVLHHFKLGRTEISTTNGSIFTYDYMRGNSEGIKSREGVRLTLCEEAQQYEADPLTSLRLTVTRVEGSQIVACMNPKNEDDPIETQIMADPDCLTVNSTLWENPFAPAKLIREAEKLREYDPEEYAHSIMGGYNLRTNELVLAGKCVIEQIVHIAGETLYYGIDWGFAEDPTCFVVASVRGDDVLIHDAVYLRVSDANDVADFLVEYHRTKPIQNIIYCDSASPESARILVKRGLPAKGSWGKHRIEDGIRWLRSHRRIVVNSGLKEYWEEMQNYRYKRDDKTGDILPIIKSGYDHGADSTRYALRRLIQKGEL